MGRTSKYPVEGVKTIRWKSGKIANYWQPGRGSTSESRLRKYWRRLPDDLSSFDFSQLDVGRIDHDRQCIEAYLTSRVSYYKSRAASKGLPATITPSFLIEMYERQQGQCAVSGIKMVLPEKNWEPSRPFAPSVDRIDNSKGYTEDNTRLVCRIVNLAISDWGTKPLVILAKAMLERGNCNATLQIALQRGAEKP